MELGLSNIPAFVSDVIESLADRGRSLFGRRTDRSPSTDSDLIELAELLLSRRGEASGVFLAQTLLSGYMEASDPTRTAFLHRLARDFGPDHKRLAAAISDYQAKSGPEQATALHRAAEPRRQELFRRLNSAPGGISSLLAMRADVLRFSKSTAELGPVDADLSHLFASWFNRGFLVLRRIDWSTPANILDEIIRYEAVHTVAGWDDLRNRLQPDDRRCYAFFHPQLPDVPLIFVEVALTVETPSAIAPLLETSRMPIAAADATTATFYSISNTQVGLTGVSFGNFLIKQVVTDLRRELPSLRTFVTLSPVPGFVPWLQAARLGKSSTLGVPNELMAGLSEPGRLTPETLESTQVRAAMSFAVATYLTGAKSSDGRPLDAVARFHLGNGARLERINILADRSAKGVAQSLGVMVNYLYAPDQIEQNHEEYVESGTVAISDAVKRHLDAKLARVDSLG